LFVQSGAIDQPPSSLHVDLNADVGESFGAYVIGDDEQLLRSVTSASVAAGFHGGDPSVLRRTIRLAKANGVRVGAHPGFPDLAGFGRRELRVTPGEAEDFVLYQIAAVAGVAAAEGVVLQHVKPHGALYNTAATNLELATAIARAIKAYDRSLVLFGPPASALCEAARAEGLRFAAEGFADRAYERDGSLVARRMPGAVLEGAAHVVSRAIGMIKERRVAAIDGAVVPLHIETICVHGDTPGAGRLAASLREGLTSAGIAVKAIASRPPEEAAHDAGGT
jgi:UPF0271 protein